MPRAKQQVVSSELLAILIKHAIADLQGSGNQPLSELLADLQLSELDFCLPD